MIHTDGTPTAASYRPTHGGYPPLHHPPGDAAGDASDPRGAATLEERGLLDLSHMDPDLEDARHREIGVPSLAPDAELAPQQVGPVWQGSARVDVTFSLRGHVAAGNAAAAGVASVQGCTLSGPHAGYWEGDNERAYTISRIGERSQDIGPAPIVQALIAAGCVAVQVETWWQSGYRCEEWRAS